MAQSHAALALKYVAVDVVGSILFFPVWWYTKGALRTARYCVRTVTGTARSFGIGIWLKNLFTPMFGQRDIQGRLISFFMRLVMIVAYSIALAVLSVVMAAAMFLWLAFPLFVAFEFGVQLLGIFSAF
jgi:hypothetical protein